MITYLAEQIELGFDFMDQENPWSVRKGAVKCSIFVLALVLIIFPFFVYFFLFRGVNTKQIDKVVES